MQDQESLCSSTPARPGPAVELAVQLSPGEPQRSAEREGAVRPATSSRPREQRLRAVRVFMSRGTGRLMISLTSPLMRIMLIFLGILPTTHSRVRHRNTAPPPIGHGPTAPPVRPHAPPDLPAPRAPPRPAHPSSTAGRRRRRAVLPRQRCGAAALATRSTRAAAAATLLLQSSLCL